MKRLPNFKVFSETPSQLLTQVSQPTAASLLSQVTSPTAASLLAQVSNPTPDNFYATVSNETAASLLVTVENLTAASLLVGATIEDRRTVDSLIDVTDTGNDTLKVADTRDVLEFTDVTYTVQNTGTSNDAVAALYLSADSVLFSIDPLTTQQTIAPTSQFFFVPGVFTKYAQIQYASLTAANTTSLSIYFQSHV